VPADYDTPVPPDNAFAATYVNTQGIMGPGAPAGVGAGMCAPCLPVPAGYVGGGVGHGPMPAMPACLPTYQTSGYRPAEAGMAMPPRDQGLPEGASAPQLLGMLKESLYPSQREWAANCLAQQDWHQQPQVVTALLMAAKEDPAPTVRAGCVRALGMMKANTLEVMQAMQVLKTDADPRVRHEVEDTMAALQAAITSREGVQPASATEKHMP
jgi:hypothetical protein